MGIFWINEGERYRLAFAYANIDYLQWVQDRGAHWSEEIDEYVKDEVSLSEVQIRAEQGETYYQFVLGVYYMRLSRYMDAYKEKHDEGMKLLMKAADKGSNKAMYAIASFYCLDGNKKLAFSWYLKAAQAGHVDAMYMVGFHYKYGRYEMVEENAREGFHWLCEAAKAGSLVAHSTAGAVLFEVGQFKEAKEALQTVEARGWTNATALLQKLPTLFKI